MRSTSLLTLAGLWAALTACTGLSLGENRPGGDTFVDDTRPSWDEDLQTFRGTGSIAVDAATDRAWLLQSYWTPDCADEDAEDADCRAVEKHLHMAGPDADRTTRLDDLTGHQDIRVLFPASGVLTMAEEDEDHDTLTLHDRTTGRVTRERTVAARYHGTRTSPTGRWVAVADNADDEPHAPIHVIDSTTLEHHVVRHDADWLEVQWFNHHDFLVAVLFYTTGPRAPSARVVGWSFVDSAPWERGSEQRWSEPTLDVTLPGVRADGFFSFTWIGISPDDLAVVVPVRVEDASRKDKDGEPLLYHELQIVDVIHRSVRRVVGAKGPVGFTPSGDTIVSYGAPLSGQGPYADGAILLIDRGTLTLDPVDTPWGDDVTYWVSRTNELVVATSPWGSDRFILLDADTLQTAEVPTEGPATLDEFVVRDAAQEMWTVSATYGGDRELGVLDLLAATYTPITDVSTPAVDVAHVALLPNADAVLVDHPSAHKLLRVDPSSRTVARKISVSP